MARPSLSRRVGIALGSRGLRLTFQEYSRFPGVRSANRDAGRQAATSVEDDAPWLARLPESKRRDPTLAYASRSSAVSRCGATALLGPPPRSRWRSDDAAGRGAGVPA